MHCPFCSVDDSAQVRRRRECAECQERFTTYETAELVMPHVIKTNGFREPFNESKLRSGLKKALQKRPVGTDQIEMAIDKIKHRLRSMGEREVPSRTIGEAVMDALKELDKVAYVRFASVYRQFEDISAFRNELDKLEKSN